ncbi:hypothetical protein DSCA_01250 [Desulfosarcina alkanivorans]|uniref:Uncharacterized protein n=1 Tax=Desulfosarcina alkanivorans TaxID=571177 RepID=A0A5K7YCP8_9BACT|nr:hypothetical protein DSCA_01250 [Desulfosarcina alkanivorans]
MSFPRKAGIYKYLKTLDPRLRGDDKKIIISISCESIKVYSTCLMSSPGNYSIVLNQAANEVSLRKASQQGS